MLYHQLVKYENPNMIFKDMGAFIRTKWKALTIEKKSCEEKQDEKKAHTGGKLWNCEDFIHYVLYFYIRFQGLAKGSQIRLLKILGLHKHETIELKLL